MFGNKKKANVGIVCVGSELLFHTVNTNIHTATRLLETKGFGVSYNVIVGDEIERIQTAVKFCTENCDVVVVSGGLGPTFDDLTRESISQLIGRKLIFSVEAWNEIQERFKARMITEIPEKNKKQAMIIEGSKMLSNKLGTAPGMMLEYKGKTIFLLPGVPAEFEEMFKEYVVSELEKRFSSPVGIVCRGFGITGVPEAVVEEKTEKLRETISRFGGNWVVLAFPYLIELWLRLPQTESSLFNKVELELREIFKDSFLGLDGISIPEALLKILKEKKLTCAFAESCTGGLAGHLITEVPGSSECFNGSMVVYSNTLKKKILKIPKTLLRKFGAVSEETAIAMSKSARKYGKADVSLAITGIAGPSGATPEKPVGLVWMAVAITNHYFESKKFYFSGTRSMIKLRAALAGIDFLRRTVMKIQ
ncbi:MAG: CinA family nicotinamide mononucleotide deamidase-related protein [Candidatus Omnitrophica bacterium]|nr:CinA family nicotinamide mononucleotide deamidase-related protein [Candidatus Omnitrophota bacterium]MCM8816320.1 CinA family nicotinamide mononucleotide deamidase-related protein [Candidatus Omnitrophota bacterium]